MKALEFGEKLKSGVSNFYQLVGEDEFLKSIVLDNFRQLVPKENLDFSYETFEESCDILQLIEALNTSSMMGGDIKIVVVQDCAKQLKIEEKKALLEYCEDANEQSVLVIVGCGNTFDCISKFCVEINCSAESESELNTYIKQVCMKKDFKIGNNQVKDIIAMCVRDLGKIMQELEKLFLYCNDEKVITDEAITLLTTVENEIKIFELTNALQKGNSQKVLEIYKALLARGEKAIMLFAIITKTYRTYFEIAISNANDDTLCKVLSISYNALCMNKKIVENAKKTQQGYVTKLKNTIDYLYNLEYNFKSGDITQENALELAISWLIAQ